MEVKGPEGRDGMMGNGIEEGDWEVEVMGEKVEEIGDGG